MITPTKYEGKRVTSWYVKFRINGGTTTEKFETEKEAWHFSRLLDLLGPTEALERLYDGDQVDAGPRLYEYIAQGIEDLTQPSRATKKRYHRIVELHWKPILPDKPMARLTRSDLAAVVNAWAADGASDKSLRNWWGAVVPIIHQAAHEGLIERDPAKGVKLPRNTEHETEEMVILDERDAHILVDAIAPHYRPLVVTLIDTGIRWGEAAGMQVGDINFKQGTMRVLRAVKESGEIGPPKTRRSRRTIYLNDAVLDQLRPLCEGRRKTDWLFTAPRGGQIRHRTFWSDIWRPAVWRAQHCADHLDPACKCGTAHPERCAVHVGDIPEPCGCEGTLSVSPRIHDMRHTHASALLGKGVPVHIVRDRLGHESIQTTVDRYGHLLPDAQKLAAEVGSMTAIQSRRELEG